MWRKTRLSLKRRSPRPRRLATSPHPPPAPAAAAEPAPEPAETAPQEPRADHGVPIAEYLREREERLNVQRQLEAYRARENPAPRPDPFLDPQGFVNAQLRTQMDPVLRQLSVAIAHNNKATAASVHGARARRARASRVRQGLAGARSRRTQPRVGKPKPVPRRRRLAEAERAARRDRRRCENLSRAHPERCSLRPRIPGTRQ